MIRGVCVAAITFLASFSAAGAADIGVVDLGTRASCNIRFIGTVSAGDLKTLKLALQKVDRALSRHSLRHP